MSLIMDTRIPSPPDFKEFLNGPGMRIALWRQPNHSEEWNDQRDQEVIERAEENAEQFPEFAKKLTESLRSGSSH